MLQLVAVVATRLQLEFIGATIDERRCYQRRVLMLPSVAELLLARVRDAAKQLRRQWWSALFWQRSRCCYGATKVTTCSSTARGAGGGAASAGRGRGGGAAGAGGLPVRAAGVPAPPRIARRSPRLLKASFSFFIFSGLEALTRDGRF
jgi:hypothetical protein